MDDKKYITESIFLLNDQTFYEENGKMKIIKKHNWHHILNEYGWEKLPKQWIKILNSYLDKPIKNSLYGSLDCGGEGDCFYCALAVGIKIIQHTQNKKHVESCKTECRPRTLQIQKYRNITVNQIKKQNLL